MVEEPKPNLADEFEKGFHQRTENQELNYVIFATTIVIIFFIVMGFVLEPKLIIEDSEKIENYQWKEVLQMYDQNHHKQTSKAVHEFC